MGTYPRRIIAERRIFPPGSKKSPRRIFLQPSNRLSWEQEIPETDLSASSPVTASPEHKTRRRVARKHRGKYSCKVSMRSWQTCYICNLQLRFSSHLYLKVALRVLRLYLKSAIIFQPELQQPPRTTSVLKSCDFPAGAAGARSATFALKSCDFQAGAAADQGGIEPGTAGLQKQARTPRDNFQKPFREQENRTAPQRERSDTHDPRRGFIGLKTNSHGATARALQHAGSPQRARQGQDKFARRHSESASTRTISAEGSPRSRQIRTAPQRKRSDTHDPRRGFIGLKTNSHGATARALRHARSPQRGAFRKLPSGLPPP